MTRDDATEPIIGAGQRLVNELSQPNDPYSIEFLIAQVGHVADYLETLNALLDGREDTWLRLKLGNDTIEVRADNALVESRQQTMTLIRLLTQINSMRRAAPSSEKLADDLDGLA